MSYEFKNDSFKINYLKYNQGVRMIEIVQNHYPEIIIFLLVINIIQSLFRKSPLKKFEKDSEELQEDYINSLKEINETTLNEIQERHRKTSDRISDYSIEVHNEIIKKLIVLQNKFNESVNCQKVIIEQRDKIIEKDKLIKQRDEIIERKSEQIKRLKK